MVKKITVSKIMSDSEIASKKETFDEKHYKTVADDLMYITDGKYY